MSGVKPWGYGKRLTCHSFLDLVQNEVHELVVALQGSNDYTQSQLSSTL
jgi:hypothetical protein